MEVIARLEDVTLRIFEKDDIYDKIRWINDPNNNKYLHYNLPLEFNKTVLWFEQKDNTKRLDCIVEYCGIPVGIIGLLNIDYMKKKAEYYITIGEKKYKHKGIAKKATKCILKYAFNDLGLHTIYLNVDADNYYAIQLYEKMGAKQEEVFKEDPLHNGHLIDRIRYSWVCTEKDI